MTKLTNRGPNWRAAAGVAAVLAALIWGGAGALAQDKAAETTGGKPGVEPDWPCPQKYVAEMSWGATWTGPSLDTALESWHDNTKLREIITLLSDDTTTEAEAITAINDFADSVEGDKEKELTELFAGLFETMNNQRTSAQAGIKRFFRRQEKVVENVNAAGAVLHDLDEKKVKHDSEEYLDARKRLAWHTRVFDERQKLTPYMCDVPVIIERHLGTYARAIEAQLEGEPMTPPAETAKP